MSYPPEPWRLRGRMYLSLWLVPAGRIPPLPAALATTVRPVLLGGRGLVGTAWVDYQPGGDLSYRELLAAVLVRARARPRVSITHIWVDCPASRDGGRALWGIPKQLAGFALDTVPGDGALAARAHAGPAAVATARLRPGPRLLPGRLPFRFRVAQDLAGRVATTPVRGRTAVRLGTARWQPDPAGPLGWLAGRRPWLTLTLADFRLAFGTGREAPADA